VILGSPVLDDDPVAAVLEPFFHFELTDRDIRIAKDFRRVGLIGHDESLVEWDQVV
jgi:hypothetical protein